MQFITILLLAIGLAMDAFAVSLSIGTAGDGFFASCTLGLRLRRAKIAPSPPEEILQRRPVAGPHWKRDEPGSCGFRHVRWV